MHKAAGVGRSFVAVPGSPSDGREGKQREGCRAVCRVALLLLSQREAMSQGRRMELCP